MITEKNSLHIFFVNHSLFFAVFFGFHLTPVYLCGNLTLEIAANKTEVFIMPDSGQGVTISVYVRPSMLERIDRFTRVANEKELKERGKPLSRNSAIVMLIVRGLAAHEETSG